jgi:DNA recombination-dependent growth factor C
MLHTDLPIYKKGYDLLSLAADVQLNMPRTFKQSLGKRVHDECVDLLLEIGYANASRGEKRCEHIRNVLRGLEVVSLMNLKALLDCDTIAMLDGWMDSNGAHLEMHIAHRVGIRVVESRAIVDPALEMAA